jgi:hypothetical protein
MVALATISIPDLRVRLRECLPAPKIVQPVAWRARPKGRIGLTSKGLMIMIPMTRLLAPAALLTVFAAGCGSSGATATSAPPASVTATPVASATTSPVTRAASTYLAIGQDVRGTRLLRPSCAKGCVLSGDSTTILWHMTWQTWTGTEAIGTGTEEMVDCTPSCAAGKQYKVAVRVTFSQPVKVCVDGGQRFWSRASFVWRSGLPSVFTGGNAPLNPWEFATIKSQAATSCG